MRVTAGRASCLIMKRILSSVNRTSIVLDSFVMDSKRDRNIVLEWKCGRCLLPYGYAAPSRSTTSYSLIDRCL